ncbi:MAG: hypothetical protein U9R60_13040 [Bacteroidota bacterium]|nr:hypothetical protein [Bacteroidota bacterium]
MRKIILLAFIAMLLPLLSFSGGKVDFKTIDQKTLEHYQSGEWQEVIYWAKLGLKAGYDYYYLRIRMGVSYFNLGKYFMAIPEFRESLTFNGGSKMAREYLYYSYLYAGQSNEAEKMKKDFPPEMLSNLGLKKSKILKMVYLETGPTFSNNYSKNGKRNLRGGQQIFGIEDLYGNNYYTHLGLDFNVSKGISWYLGYSNLIVDKRESIQYPIAMPSNLNDIEYNYKVYQNELYTNLLIPFANGWRLIPAFHLLHDTYKPLEVTYQSYEITDTSYFDYIASLGLSKQLKWLNLGLSAAYSTLNGRIQQQYGLSFMYYPLGNLDFFGQTAIQGLIEEGETNIVFQQMLGAKVLRKLWIELLGSFGDMSLMTEKNAFVVYNLSDKIKYRLSANVIYSINEHIEVSLRYQFYEKEGTWLQYQANGPETFKIRTRTYQTHQILGGLTWKL